MPEVTGGGGSSGAVGVLDDGDLAVGVRGDVDGGADLVAQECERLAQQRARGPSGLGELEGGACGVDARGHRVGQLGADQVLDGVSEVELGQAGLPGDLRPRNTFGVAVVMTPRTRRVLWAASGWVLTGWSRLGRSATALRLTTVTSSGLLPDDLHQMGVYYLAKTHRDLGDSTASRHGMQLVAGGGRLAPAARRGLARLADDFPTAYETARTLGWAGRQHRVEGDILWPHGDMNRAAAAYIAACDHAEHHGVAGERATSQAQRALVLAFTDPTPRTTNSTLPNSSSPASTSAPRASR
ncbi:hypothetical protein ACFY04_28765 [Streptomyces sp. NPDC001549]|uniref:hypothetical protein n=1 Tax=Streptomyces sp. NPDC001549 TaxID=3364586 RepID=UPI0036796171